MVCQMNFFFQIISKTIEFQTILAYSQANDTVYT